VPLHFGGEWQQCPSKRRGPANSQTNQQIDLIETYLRCVILEVAAQDFRGGGAAHGKARRSGAGGLGRRC
jgi:hypothetical protein